MPRFGSSNTLIDLDCHISLAEATNLAMAPKGTTTKRPAAAPLKGPPATKKPAAAPAAVEAEDKTKSAAAMASGPPPPAAAGRRTPQRKRSSQLGEGLKSPPPVTNPKVWEGDAFRNCKPKVGYMPSSKVWADENHCPTGAVWNDDGVQVRWPRLGDLAHCINIGEAFYVKMEVPPAEAGGPGTEKYVLTSKEHPTVPVVPEILVPVNNWEKYDLANMPWPCQEDEVVLAKEKAQKRPKAPAENLGEVVDADLFSLAQPSGHELELMVPSEDRQPGAAAPGGEGGPDAAALPDGAVGRCMACKLPMFNEDHPSHEAFSKIEKNGYVYYMHKACRNQGRAWKMLAEGLSEDKSPEGQAKLDYVKTLDQNQKRKFFASAKTLSMSLPFFVEANFEE